jgi:hypothetical protein
MEEKSFASAGDRIPVVHIVVKHCTNWATPAPDLSLYNKYFNRYSYTLAFRLGESMLLLKLIRINVATHPLNKII